ncbi:MAG TPA: hypothetical protein PLV45_17160 [bacterium]|nr:hypothetical protein [bacterium]
MSRLWHIVIVFLVIGGWMPGEILAEPARETPGELPVEHTGKKEAGTMADQTGKSEEKKVTKDQAHQYFAVALNNRTWELLGRKDRTPAENEEMIHAAHGSCWHWMQIGTPVNHQRGEWLISRVYAVLGMAEPAVYHAQLCRELTEKYAGEMQDFDRAYAWESLARAYAVSGDAEVAAEYRAKAVLVGQAISGDEDRKMFMSDLESGDWHGVK